MAFGTSNMKIDFSLLKSVFMYPYRCYKRRYYKKNMKKFGMSSWIEKPLRLQGLQNISIGENVGVHHRSWLAALPLTGKEVSLIIRDCREMPKKVFDFPNELIDKVIEIS